MRQINPQKKAPGSWPTPKLVTRQVENSSRSLIYPPAISSNILVFSLSSSTFFIIFLLFYFPAVYYIYFFVTSTLIHHTLSIKSFFVFIFYLFDYLGLGHPL
jgi:hypothetical protein